MNLHPFTFIQIMEICATLEDTDSIKDMIESMEQLERNIRTQRQGLKGRLSLEDFKRKQEHKENRHKRKQAFQLINGKDRK